MLRARRRVPRCFLGRLGDGGGEPILRVVRAGDKLRLGFLFIDVLNPRPEPGGGLDDLSSIHAGFAVTTFLPDDDIPYFTHILFVNNREGQLRLTRLYTT